MRVCACEHVRVEAGEDEQNARARGKKEEPTRGVVAHVRGARVVNVCRVARTRVRERVNVCRGAYPPVERGTDESVELSAHPTPP